MAKVVTIIIFPRLNKRCVRIQVKADITINAANQDIRLYTILTIVFLIYDINNFVAKQRIIVMNYSYRNFTWRYFSWAYNNISLRAIIISSICCVSSMEAVGRYINLPLLGPQGASICSRRFANWSANTKLRFRDEFMQSWFVRRLYIKLSLRSDHLLPPCPYGDSK